jgi:penicillin-binding protein 1B
MATTRKQAKGQKASRVKRPRFRLLKIAALVISIPVIVISIFLIRYYFIFNGLIEQKLAQRFAQAETEVYASPTVLYPGKRIRFTELQAKLRRLGYQEQSTEKNSRSSAFSLTKANRLLVRNEPGLPEDADRAVELTCSETTIRSIVDSGSRSSLPRFSLKPEMLSMTINKNREKRRLVTYRDIPKILVQAVVAAEDRRFFTHNGVDPIRILKAVLVDIREGDKVQGASTLTQQFVKNYFLTPEKTWRRKLSDAYMSILIEKRLSKEQIFELYSNEVYLGQAGSFSLVGFGEAADVFFDKSLKELNLGEAAVLAGMITAPNRYTPLRYPERAKARRNLVLDGMAEEGMITPAERDEAKRKPLEVKPSAILNYSEAPYFVDYIQDILAESYGDVAVGVSKYKVYTSLEMDLQQAAFEAVRDGVVALDDYFAKGKRGIPPGTVQASLIAVDPRTGQVLAMIGGRNYGASQFNRITQSKRQPGSIFKPFVYTAALETAYTSSTPLTAVSTVLDEPTQFEFENLLYEPRNFKDEFLGQVTMRQAISKSLNVATIKFAEKTGYPKIVDLAHRLGLNEQIKPYPAMAIGSFEVTPLEMVRAYTAFANGGLLSDLSPILRIVDAKADPIFVAEPKPKKVLEPEVAYMTTSLLQSVINSGTGAGSRARGFTLPAAGKTGTSRDGWFAGYTPDMLCIVWVGFDDNRELNLPGSQAALPIWTDFMKRAVSLRPLSGEDFIAPDGIVQVEIDPTTGLLATDHCLERQNEYFIKGSAPALACYGNSYEQMLSQPSVYSVPNRPSQPESKKNPPERQ